jgi:diacylglycerol O-acyltransferase/trehalose O-mycolyltransferase
VIESSRGILVAFALALAIAGCGGGGNATTPAAGGRATVVGEQRVGDRLLDLTVASPAVGADVTVRLMTPVGWRKGADRRWPVLYLLHGCCDDYRAWTRSTAVEQYAPLRRALVVMPDAGRIGFYSDWRDGPAWERFHLHELRGLLERDYGAGDRRAIAGLSMGGLGALVYAARAPHLFRAAAAFSGLLHPLHDPEWIEGLMSRYSGDPGAIWGDPERDRDTWARHDPAELAAKLDGVPLFVSSGDGSPGPLDPPGAGDDAIEREVLAETRAFLARAHAAGLTVDADLYGAGTHGWRYFQRELLRSLPLLMRPLRLRRPTR